MHRTVAPIHLATPRLSALIVLAALGLSGLACSAAQPSNPAGSGGSGSSSDAFSGSGGASSGSGDTSSGSSDASSGSGSSGTGSSGGGAIYPLEVGYTWTWNVDNYGPNGCNPNPATTTAQKLITLAGRDVYETNYICIPDQFTHLNKTPDGGVDIYFDDTGWITQVGGKLEEGYTWPSRFSTMTWHHEGTVTVPAGTFEGCWRAVQNVSYTSWNIYCPGVGPVHAYQKDLSGGVYEALLISKNF